MATVTTPNHSQAARISRGIQDLRNGKPTPDWHGNSYKGIVSDNLRLYTLIHWNTPIAQLIFDDGDVQVTHFDARYHSATTRGFQGRILSALTDALGDDHPDVVRIREELSRPTYSRSIFSY